MIRLKPATAVWVGGVGGILLADLVLVVCGEDSLTQTYAEALVKNPKAKYLLPAAFLYLGLHLHADQLGIPERIKKLDPLALIGRIASK